MTCRGLSDFLGDYIDGDLAPAERGEFEKHLAICETCQRYVESYRQTIRLGKEAFADPDASVSEDVPERLVQAILAARRRGGT